jgi:hypothetical protein
MKAEKPGGFKVSQDNTAAKVAPSATTKTILMQFDASSSEFSL